MTSAPPPGPEAPARPRRRAVPFFQDPEKRSVEIGIAATILVHLLLLLLVPALFPNRPVHPSAKRSVLNRPLNLQIDPATFLRKPPPPKFVEANPNANNNIPQKTDNIAAQNQTVAQEKPNPNGKSDMPALEGRKDIQSTQIVTGHLEQEQARAQPTPQAPATPPKPATEAPRREQTPLPGTEKLTGDDKAGFGTNVQAPTDNGKDIPQKVAGAKDAPDNPNATANQPRIDPLHPQPRRMLPQHVRPAVFAENKVGTSNIGPTAVDARWNAYADYLQRMIESIQIEWDRIIGESAIYPPRGSTVSVKFILDSKGRIKAIEDVNSTSSDQGKTACEAAITNRSPYGEWTQQMINMLGTEQEMTFTFFYQ